MRGRLSNSSFDDHLVYHGGPQRLAETEKGRCAAYSSCVCSSSSCRLSKPKFIIARMTVVHDRERQQKV